MLRFTARRLVFIILVSILIVFSVHLGMRMIRNSEARQPDVDLIQISKRSWQDTRAYVQKALGGNFGVINTQYGSVRVVEILKETYVNSMGLLLVALVVATAIEVYFGASAALARSKRYLFPVLTLTILGISTPAFFCGLLLRQAELRYLALTGHQLVSMAGFGWDVKHMLMPVLVLSARPLAYLTRAAFLALGVVMGEDYIRTAHSKGLRRSDVVNVHAMRNVAVPIITAIGISLRFSLGILPVVELFFDWPGIGLGLLQAINQRQTTLVVTLALALGVTLLGINLVLDIVYRFVDPRIRES